MASRRRYTWKPDLPDFRDHVLKAVAPQLPSHVDLRPGCSPVEDQGNLGSCTGHAWAGALEFLERREGAPVLPKSRLFIYYGERVIEHTTRHDDGAQIRDGAKTLHQRGCCVESLWPYKVSKFALKPARAAYTDAAKHKISEYLRCADLASIRQSLADGFPVVTGISVYESFESATVAKTGVVPMPAHTEKCLGGHAVLIVGYDDASQRVIVRNSWGAGWGDKGYFTLPYAYVESKDLCDDSWTVRR